MTTYDAGTDAVLTAQFYQYPGGPAVDVTGLTLTVQLVGGSTPAVGPTSGGISHLGTGLYAYTWSIPAIQQTGTYGTLWQGTAGSSTVQASETFDVDNAPAIGSWSSVADTASITGITVAASDVTAGQAIIEQTIRRVWRDTDATSRDYYWLRRAVAWQAGYVHQHPEVLAMMGVQSLSQDGLSLSVPEGAAVHLAPLARLALNNLFRATNTTVRFNSAFQRTRSPRRSTGPGASIPWTDI